MNLPRPLRFLRVLRVNPSPAAIPSHLPQIKLVCAFMNAGTRVSPIKPRPEFLRKSLRVMVGFFILVALA